MCCFANFAETDGYTVGAIFVLPADGRGNESRPLNPTKSDLVKKGRHESEVLFLSFVSEKELVENR